MSPGSRVWSNPDTRRKLEAPAWASMLNVPRGGSRGGRRSDAAGGGMTGDRPIVLNVNFDRREFGQIWVDVGRKEVTTRGGLRATFGGLD